MTQCTQISACVTETSILQEKLRCIFLNLFGGEHAEKLPLEQKKIYLLF
jgi:hypothetical protein